MSHEAMLYHLRDDGGTVVCDLCHHRCALLPGGVGVCRARRNEGGRLLTLLYGRCVALNPDPIEKKPLFHFLPGTRAMSVATVGCNFTCDFCQNYHISQALREREGEPPGDWIEPVEIVEAAVRRRCASIAFTYTEPTVFFEYAFETARLAHARGIASCFVSNGYMTPEAVDTIAPYLAAINVDLKCFSDSTYRKVIGGRLEKVLETIAYLHAKGIWIELTTLLVPGMNDSAEEIGGVARFVAELSPDIPWHVSRFHPQFRMNQTPSTPCSTIEKALKIGREAGLRYIYCGNMRENRSESTWCASCGALLVARSSYAIGENRLGEGGACPDCGTVCPGVWRYP